MEHSLWTSHGYLREPLRHYCDIHFRLIDHRTSDNNYLPERTIYRINWYVRLRGGLVNASCLYLIKILTFANDEAIKEKVWVSGNMRVVIGYQIPYPW